jgi:ABC-type spermidine/putrescine transport system permease subunit I
MSARRRPVLLSLLAAVPGLWLAAFFLAPLATTVVASFHQPGFGSVGPGLTLDNYGRLAGGIYLNAFGLTVVSALVSSAITIVLALPVAYVIARARGRVRTILLALVLVPYFSSFLIRVLSWQVLLGADGPVLWVARLFGAGGLELLGTPRAIIIGMVYGYLPIAILPLFLVLRRIPTSVLDAAGDLGAGPVRRFFTVTLPLARPGIATAAMLTAVPMLGELVIPQILGAGRGLFLGQLVQTEYLRSQNYAFGSAIAVAIMVAVGVLVAVLLRFTRGFDEVAS